MTIFAVSQYTSVEIETKKNSLDEDKKPNQNRNVFRFFRCNLKRYTFILIKFYFANRTENIQRERLVW